MYNYFHGFFKVFHRKFVIENEEFSIYSLFIVVLESMKLYYELLRKLVCNTFYFFYKSSNRMELICTTKVKKNMCPK